MAVVIGAMQGKGGVGKTTTITNLAVTLARSGHPTLVIDFDPAGEQKDHLGAVVGENRGTLAEAIIAGDLSPLLCETRTPNLYCIPHDNSIKPKSFDEEEFQQLLLDEALEPLHPEFEFILLDVKGGLDLVGQMAMYAAHLVIIPVNRDVQTQQKALLTMDYARSVAKRRNKLQPHRPPVDPDRFAKYLLSEWDENKVATKELAEELECLDDSTLFKTKVEQCEDVQKARNAKMSVAEYAKGLRGWQVRTKKVLSRVLAAYEKLAEEVKKHEYKKELARAGNE